MATIDEELANKPSDKPRKLPNKLRPVANTLPPSSMVNSVETVNTVKKAIPTFLKLSISGQKTFALLDTGNLTRDLINYKLFRKVYPNRKLLKVPSQLKSLSGAPIPIVGRETSKLGYIRGSVKTRT